LRWELAEALPILKRLYAPLFNDMEQRIVDDHICDRAHLAGQCLYRDSAKDTKLGALLDTPDSLERRLLSGAVASSRLSRIHGSSLTCAAQ